MLHYVDICFAALMIVGLVLGTIMNFKLQTRMIGAAFVMMTKTPILMFASIILGSIQLIAFKWLGMEVSFAASIGMYAYYGIVGCISALLYKDLTI